jgi:hypothetical protein
MRIILFILVINALLIGSIGWAEEPQTPSSAQTPAPAGESASPPSNEQQTTQPAEAAPAPAPAPTAPSAPAQEEKEKKKVETTPGASLPAEAAPAPAPAPTTPSAPAPPSGTPPTEAAPAPAPAPTTPAAPASPSGPPSTEAAPAPAPAPTAPSAPAPPSGPPPTAATKEQSAQHALEQTQEEKEKKKVEITTPEASLIKGRLQIELIESYVHTSSNQLFIEGLGLLPVLILGPIEVQKIRRDILNTTFVIRYKITNKLQASLNIPYQFGFSRISAATGTSGGGTVANATTETSSSSAGLGDISGTLTYLTLNESLARPSVTLALSFKGRTGQDVFESDNPTGSGFNSIGFSINASKTSDPAVLFGYLSYAYAIPRRDVVFTSAKTGQSTLINFEPGDNIGLGFGIAYALNYKLTLSLQFQESINMPSQINHNQLPNSMTNSASLRFGGTWRVNDKTTIDLSITPGITSDSADFILSLRIPWRF